MSSKIQFFLVIEKIEQCRWTFYGEQRERDILPGNLIVIKPCNNGINDFEVHRGSGTLIFGPKLASRDGGLPRDKIVSITGQEFDILVGVDGTTTTDGRFELYSSGRLKWACGLKVGDDVKVKLGRNNEPVTGVIRGSGTRPLPYAYGLQFIVEITVKPCFDQRYLILHSRL